MESPPTGDALSASYDKFITERSETKRKAFASVARFGFAVMLVGFIGTASNSGGVYGSLWRIASWVSTFFVVSGLVVLSTLPVEGSESLDLDDFFGRQRVVQIIFGLMLGMMSLSFAFFHPFFALSLPVCLLFVLRPCGVKVLKYTTCLCIWLVIVIAGTGFAFTSREPAEEVRSATEASAKSEASKERSE